MRADKNKNIPSFVFLAHVVDITSSMHAPFVFRSLASKPYAVKLFLVPLWPLAFMHMVVMWVKSKTFLISFYKLRGNLHQTWAVPRFGFHVRFFFDSCCLFIQFSENLCKSSCVLNTNLITCVAFLFFGAVLFAIC